MARYDGQSPCLASPKALASKAPLLVSSSRFRFQVLPLQKSEISIQQSSIPSGPVKSSATPLAVQGRTTTEDTEHTEGHRGSSFVVLRSWFIRLLLLPVQVSGAPPSKIRNQKSAFSNRVFPRAPNEVVRDSARGSRQDNHGRHGTHGRAQRFFVRSSGFASRLRSSPFYRKQVHRKSSDNRRGQRFFVRSSGLSPCLVHPIPAPILPACPAGRHNRPEGTGAQRNRNAVEMAEGK
jgi:hypothetical protein